MAYNSLTLSSIDNVLLNDSQKRQIDDIHIAYAKATTPQERAALHNAAEVVRAGAGYSGGKAGDTVIQLPAPIQSVVDTVKSIFVPSNNQTSVGNAVNSLTPAPIGGTAPQIVYTATAPAEDKAIVMPGQQYISGLTGSTSSELTISPDLKKVGLYGGLAVVSLMVFKMLMERGK